MTSHHGAPLLLRHNSRASNTSGNSGSSFGFRLNDEIETSSVYSIYKQKIDRMFNSENIEQNNVQVRIEKMFNDIAHEEGFKEENRHVFSVDYLGSVPLQEKVTNLNGLQDPLKKLYFTYKKTMKKRLTGRLEISSSGLKVIYQGQNGILEQLNPYPTIAVWSAVKFVIQDKKFAFLPLITDPDTCEKQNLFQTLEENNKYITNENHQPLFTVVMRKIGLGKTLEMHSFVCQTSEDAIVIAATLYKSLMTFMKHKTVKPKNKNGLGCLSISSSTYTDSIIPVRPPRKKKSLSMSSQQSLTSKNSLTPVKKSPKTKQAPTVPPEKTKVPESGHKSKNSQNQSDIDEIRAYEEPMDDLKRCRSLRKENMNTNNIVEGDILTKVTIPRSGSFLNAGGLTRYKSKVNRTNGLTSGGSPLGFSELFAEFRLQENLHSLDEILAAIVNPNGMSFNDLKPIYKEFLLKLAVTLTKDELYQRAKAIIRRKKRRERKKKTVGLGVQKIKRVFRKSFRLNLSKKLKNKKLKHLNTSNIKKSNKSESTISSTSYDTKQFQPKQNLNKKHNFRRKNSDKNLKRDRLSTSEDSDFFTIKRKEKLSPSNQNRNSSSGYVSCSECSYSSDTCTCISADKCYCSLGNRQRPQNYYKPKTVASCVSCKSFDVGTLSYCGCETDTCTESEKCYCNVQKDRKSKKGQKNNKFDHKSRIFSDLHINDDRLIHKKYKKIDKSYCPDQYCQKKYNNNYNNNCFQCERCIHGFLFQNKHKNCLPTNDELISQPTETRKLCKKNSNTRSTTSVEYLKNPSEKYYEKLKSKYEHEIISQQYHRRSYSENNLCNTDLINREIYGRALSEITPKNGLCSVRSFQSFNSSRKINTGKPIQKTVPASSSNEALSVKKSAEIAALFTDLKLSQTTDITHMAPKNYSVNNPQNFGVRPRQFNSVTNTKFDKKAIVTPYKHTTNNKMVQNSLYGSRMVHGNKNGMYSTKNGLYTIQSQSDTSSSENGKKNNLENTLGYLP